MVQSLSDIIGLSQTQGDSHASTSAFKPALAFDSRVDPDDYPTLASSVRKEGKDIRTLYGEALAAAEDKERDCDRQFLDRAKEFVELNEQVETSTKLLTDLSAFLSTFQIDLSSVSGHISELQGRSKTIEGRLDSRKAVERSLNPFISSIAISPALIKTIVDTEVSDAWVPAVIELDAKLGSIRSGPRVEGRRVLDEVAESLRLKVSEAYEIRELQFAIMLRLCNTRFRHNFSLIQATQKILLHFVALLKPFETSVSISLQDFQEKNLLPLKPLFDFLRRHSARQAHDFQKVYVNTVRWYYETGFRRYIRALEKMRTRVTDKTVPIGLVSHGINASLALLSKKSANLASDASGSDPVDYSRLSGPAIYTIIEASDKTVKPNPEALFRSVSIVLKDNAETEYAFVATFFGQHSSLTVPQSMTPSLYSSSNASSSTFATISRKTSVAELRSGSGRRLEDDEESVATTTVSVAGAGGGGSENVSHSGTRMQKDDRDDKARRTMVDGIWRNIMDPALEYSRNFINALLDPAHVSPSSLLSMILLNETILKIVLIDGRCPSCGPYQTDIRMLLWPALTKSMSTQVESVQKINGSLPTSTAMGISARGAGSNVKDSVVQVVAMRYADLFNTFLRLITNGDQEDQEQMVFSSLLRLRQEVDKLLLYQASKMTDPAKRKAFLKTHYEELFETLSTSGRSSHSRSQAEVAHYRELSRKLG